MVVENVVDRQAMVVGDKSRIRGISDMTTTVLDPPRAMGVKATPETSKGRSQRTTSIAARRAIEKVSVGSRIRQGRTGKSAAITLRQRFS